VSARTGSGNTPRTPDRVTLEARSLHFYQLAHPARRRWRVALTRWRRAGKETFDGKRAVRDLHVPPLFTSRATICTRRRDRSRFLPVRPLADSHVPHRPARGTVDSPEGRLLPRRRFATLRTSSSTTTVVFRLGLTEPEKGRSDRVSEVAVNEMTGHGGLSPRVPRLLSANFAPDRNAGRTISIQWREIGVKRSKRCLCNPRPQQSITSN